MLSGTTTADKSAATCTGGSNSLLIKCSVIKHLNFVFLGIHKNEDTLNGVMVITDSRSDTERFGLDFLFHLNFSTDADENVLYVA